MAPRKPEEVSALVTDATVIAGTHSGLLSAAGEATLAADGGAAQLPATALQRGDSIDRYLILARLGEGGMGLVYAAHDPELDRKVAIKLLRGDPTDSGARDRLLREAQAMARLSHPNVITVHDVGTARGHVFVAMEYVEGGTLGTWLEEQERGWRAVLDVFLAAGRGLAAAHEAGLVHRDFKPDNVLLERDGRVRVADFGLARYGLGAAPTHPPAPAEAPTDMTRTGVSLNTKLTITGATVGTPAYMAPEQLGGVDVDARADQFAFCVALYEGLYGERPFAGRTLGEIHINVGADAVRPPAPGRSVPSWLRRIVLQGLRAAPERRHPSMRALLEQLERTPGRRRRRLLGAAAIVALSGGALAIQQLAAARARPCTGAAGRVGEVWSSEHAATAAAAFAASGLSYAAATWTSARARLDAYADDWAKMYTDACEATHVRDEQSVELLDLRMACLERDRQQLAAVVELLEHADREVIEGAVSAVDALPELARCADVPELTGKPPTPDDPAVDELHAALDRASALYVAGKYPDSVAPARAALAIAERLHHGPLLAEAHLMLGKALSTTSVYDEAERELDEAFNRSLASRELRIATRAASQQIFVMRKHKSRLDDAERWAATAHAAIEGLGGDDELTTIVLTNELQIARQRGEHDKARALRRRVLERRLARFPEDSIRVAEARNNAAVGLYDDGRYEDARRELERALVVYYATYGPDHPKVLQARASLAVFMRSLGDYATAVTIMRENYDAYERTLGPNNDDTIDALSNLAVGYIDNGEFDLAEECMLETYERNAALHGDDSVDAAASLGNLAALAMQRRQFAAGETKARVALAGLTKAFGEKHPHVLIAHKMLGSALRGQGRLDEALAEFERARELAEALPPEHPQRGWTRFELAKTYTERDEPGRALELLDEAERRLNDGAQPLTEEDRATLDLARAQALAARGDAGDEVARLAVAARSYYAREPKRRVNELADIDELLAAAPAGR